ncbi:TPA: hypothetical protein KOY70_003308 [Clostridioides difficile]|nr:hypothetical protein [Clostridioides difficile]
MNKKIANLNSSELEKVFKINSKLRNYIKKEIEEFKTEEINDLLNYIKDSLSDYSISLYNNNYMNIKNREEFLNGIKKVSINYNILSNNEHDFLYKTIKVYNRLKRTNYYDNSYRILEIKFNLMIDKLKEIILKRFNLMAKEESETDLFETFLILYVNDKISDNEFYVDENYVLYKRVSFL